MDETQSRKLATIRALLAKAEDPAATEAEAESYNRKAAQLIAQYGIDAAMLAEADPKSDVLGDRRIKMDAPYAYDKLTLIHVIAQNMRCRVIALPTKTSKGKTYTAHLFGHQSDMDAVELLFTSLLLQAATGVSRTTPPSWLSASAKAAYKRTWLAGFSTAVDTRLSRAARQATQTAEAAPTTGRSAEMVLADRTALVERAVEDRYRDLRSNTRKLSGSGFGAGHTAGSRADLGSDTSSVSRAGNRQQLG